MRFLATLVIAGIILSVIKALIPALILLLAVSLVWALITKPFELLGFAFLCLISAALQLRPATTIMCIAGVALFLGIRRPAQQPEKEA